MLAASHIEALDEFLDLIKEGAPADDKPELKSTQRKELELWHAWNKGGRKPKHLKPLYDSYKPLIEREARKFTNKVELPTSAIHAELRKQFVNAVKTYDAKKGAALGSWVQTNLRKASRFVKTYQNFGKIPEGNISSIRTFNQAHEELSNKFGHEPDTKTLADHLKWPHKRVIQIQKELSRADKPLSGYMTDPAEVLAPKELEAVRLINFDNRLSKEDRAVYEYTFGMNGRPRLQPGQIAKKTGIHPSKVSRIRGKLKGLVHEAMDVL
jgi:DNA-directed RNA polymerase specialized sigma subunit